MKRPEIHQLPDDPELLKQLILTQNEQLKMKQSRINLLEEQIKLFKFKHFGKSSEKSADQAELFDEAETEVLSDAPESAEVLEPSKADDTSSDTPAKTHTTAGRKPLPEDLPRHHIIHDLPEHEKLCDCGCLKVEIGEETFEELEIIPAQVIVNRHHRKKYACKACEGKVQLASAPEKLLPKSNASAGLLAHLVVAKYQDGLPLYRMEAIFERMNIRLPRNTLANWMIQCSDKLQPLYNLLNDRLLSSGYLHMDETTVQVLKEPDKPAESKSYMWVRKTGDPDCPIILFDYAPSRSGSVVESLLPDYQGYLQTDDYAGYHKTGDQEGIIHLGCMAHARRKFVEAQKVTKNKSGKPGKADMAINMMKKLYQVEQAIKFKSPEERYQVRQEQSLPLLTKLKAWLEKSLLNTLPKGKLGEALAYLSKNWTKLIRYTEDGRLNIDNNPVENAIRPFAIGRKNWMFSNSQAGAKTSAMLYSMIETAKANGLEPYAYLRTVFTKLPACQTVENFEQLLPWNVVLEPIPEISTKG